MSDNQETGSDSVEETTESVEDVASLFYPDESEPTEEPTDLTDEDEGTQETDDDAEETGDGQPETESDDDSEELVVDGDNEFVKYEHDEESGLYSFKSNGKKVKVNTKELISNYQAGQKLNIELEKIAEERKGMTPDRLKEIEVLQAQQSQYTERLKKLDGVIKEVDDTTNWEELKELDPTEYLLRREQQEERKKIQADANEQTRKDSEAQHAEITASESQKLLDVIGDDWKDADVRDSDIKAMREFAKSINITEAEMVHLKDHRFWLALRAGAQLKAFNEKKFEVKKTPPKSVKSKVRQPAKASNEDKSDAELFYGYK